MEVEAPAVPYIELGCYPWEEVGVPIEHPLTVLFLKRLLHGWTCLGGARSATESCEVPGVV